MSFITERLTARLPGVGPTVAKTLEETFSREPLGTDIDLEIAADMYQFMLMVPPGKEERNAFILQFARELLAQDEQQTFRSRMGGFLTRLCTSDFGNSGRNRRSSAEMADQLLEELYLYRNPQLVANIAYQINRTTTVHQLREATYSAMSVLGFPVWEIFEPKSNRINDAVEEDIQRLNRIFSRISNARSGLDLSNAKVLLRNYLLYIRFKYTDYPNYLNTIELPE